MSSPSENASTPLPSEMIRSTLPQQQQQPENIVHGNESDKTCVVCFKIVDIFSIGECDHPVCYECSTRMRVLCKQNECPICRRINQKVIFTSEILPYKELDQKNRSCLYDKTFRICFTGQRAQNAFRRLLEHTCNKCNAGPFDTAGELKDHLRKKHELFYCDICMEHLKIFSFERRAYTREQLAMHRRKGDPDNKSHRGHPLCEYCDERYLDRDELFRHLRKEHYFCHFCDADGSNQFYADHTSLRDHFIDQHFLCEDGDCKENIFSAVFRTDIDLKAHKANVHGQTSKQARMIEFNFNLAPRGRSSNQDASTANSMAAEHTQPSTATTSNQSPRKIIDAQNEQEFPSLGGQAPINLRPTVTLNMRPSTSGLARTKENFPALGGSSAYNRPIPATTPSHSVPPASTLLFKSSAAKSSSHANGHNATKSTSNNNNNNNNNKSKTVPMKTNDFPALPGSSTLTSNRTTVHRNNNLDSDMVETPLAINTAVVSAKHRQLVHPYESACSAANTLANQKIKTVQRAESKQTSSPAHEQVPSIKSKENFPALGAGGSSSAATAPQWLNEPHSKKQNQISKKLKVAPAPILPSSNKSSSENGRKDEETSKKAKSKANDKKKDATKSSNEQSNETKKPDKAKKTSDDNSKKMKDNNQKNAEQNGNNRNEIFTNSYSSVAHFTMPPPGFPVKAPEKNIKAPPGFEGQPKDSKSSHTFMSPSNALQRNKILVGHFMKSLKAPALEEFRNVSRLFRSSMCNARAYYEHCQAVLGDRFESIFPELLALLPDINKQQELYQTYLEKHNQAKSNELNNYIQVCDRCRQVLKRGDFPEHQKFHAEIDNDNKLNKNFPKLSMIKK